MGQQRRTKQREAIEKILHLSKDFRSAQQIHAELSQAGSSISLATVYRNLQGMSEAKEVDYIRAEDGETLYRLCHTDAHHHHLVCRECGLTVDVSAETFETWVEQISKQHGFSAVEHSADLFGLCNSCTNK